MILNNVERAVVNNPVRALLQHRLEAPLFRRLGADVLGGRLLEIGCGRGIGVEVLLRRFDATEVHAFDLDPAMVDVARARHRTAGDRVRLWAGSATDIDAPDGHYDAVFVFAIFHHIPAWRDAVAEVRRVLRPGGVFAIQEVYRAVIVNPVMRRLMPHPQEDRFDHGQLRAACRAAGLAPQGELNLADLIGWQVFRSPDSGS